MPSAPGLGDPINSLSGLLFVVHFHGDVFPAPRTVGAHSNRGLRAGSDEQRSEDEEARASDRTGVDPSFGIGHRWPEVTIRKDGSESGRQVFVE